ncbi:hypothetical protein HF882_22090 [Victivallis vadensis]|uniref:DUF6259 domain-containing protein n=1 Tax=Victivallis vadensis TaxID=172901 RepID=A0A848B297_9BACT|nr:DUF6259 domain-containing protein [Victivallis vadensis]NMD89281.1 hypothetical protein [Victivallis vadensis]
MFIIQLRDFIGNPLRINRSDFSDATVHKSHDGFEITYSGCRKLRGTIVKVWTTLNETEIRWRISISLENSACRCEWVDFPRIRLRRSEEECFLLPFAEGTLIDRLDQRENASFKCEYSEYPLSGINGFYPGPAAMQFEACFQGNTGLYIGCADPSHAPKTLDIQCEGDDARRIMVQNFTGGASGPAFEIVTVAFAGNWQDAAEIYRVWMTEYDPFLPEKISERIPDWLKKSPIVVAFPVRGHGLDSSEMAPNEYFPYVQALPVLNKLRERWRGPLLALLMHWEGTAPWAPPYIWPPYGGEAALREFTDAMHNAGDRVGLYASGIGWTQQSVLEPAYDCREQFEAEKLGNVICTGPRGEAYSRNCNGAQSIRLGYDLCPACDVTAEIVCDEISAAHRAKIDYLQYFDQNQGAASPLCYSAKHEHPSLPGAWQTVAMRTLLKKAALSAEETVLGCENAAAEPYMEFCKLNDLRSHLAWGTGGMPVPLYSYLFHEYCIGFSGNGVCLSEWIDTEKTPFFLQWNVAWNFVNGNLLSVVLKDGGKIHWNWGLSWKLPEPEQQPLLTLIANLAKWRQGRAGRYLVAGRMEKALHVQCAVGIVYHKNAMAFEVPMVLSSAWSDNGKKAVILVNCNTKPEACRIDFETPCSGMQLSQSGETEFDTDSLCLVLPPLDVVILEY